MTARSDTCKKPPTKRKIRKKLKPPLEDIASHPFSQKYVENGTLSIPEWYLLRIIEQIIKTRGNMQCWANDDFLAKKMNITSQQIRLMIIRLKLLGFIIQIGTKEIDGQLHDVVETIWTKTLEKAPPK